MPWNVMWFCRVFLLALVIMPTGMNSAPHIIVIVADDLGWGDVSFHGSLEIPTPNIDALASESVVLDHYYVSQLCTPSRSALLSGFHPIHTGMQHDVIVAGEPWGLPLNFTLLPQHLKALGYSTHAIGKWHLGFTTKEDTPTFRGFESHFGYWTGHIDYFDHTAQVHSTQAMDFRHNLTLVAPEYFNDYATTVLNGKAVELILNYSNIKPLFLYLSHLAVHAGNSYSPLQAPLKYVERFPHIKDPHRRIFAGMVAALDDSVGDVIKALTIKGMLNNSIIIFTTDNGAASHGIDGSCGSNWPLRGLKYTLWEGGVRGVAMIWSPLLKGHPRVYEGLMHISDWLPTIYHAAGGNPKTLGTIDGIDMWEPIAQDLPSKRIEVLHNIDPIWEVSAIRVGEYKLVNGSYANGQFDGWYQPPESTYSTTQILKHLSIVKDTETAKILSRFSISPHTERPKLIRINCGPQPMNVTTNCIPNINPCLFHIPSDPCEYNNLAEQHPDIVQTLLFHLEEYRSTAVPPQNKPYDAKANPALHGYAWTPWMGEE